MSGAEAGFCFVVCESRLEAAPHVQAAKTFETFGARNAVIHEMTAGWKWFIDAVSVLFVARPVPSCFLPHKKKVLKRCRRSRILSRLMIPLQLNSTVPWANIDGLLKIKTSVHREYKTKH